MVVAVRPALSLHQAVPYVAGAYLVFLAMIVIYIAIMARKQRRLSKEVRGLVDDTRRDATTTGSASDRRDVEHARAER